MPDPNLPTETDKQPEPVTTPQPVSEPTVPPTTPTTPPADPAPPIDYEKKFAESTREYQILQAQLDEERQKNARRELTTEPTDSELQAAFPDWDIMTDTEKRLARETSKANRIASTLQQEREQEKAERQWTTDLELTIAQNPSLQGKELAFKEFAKKPTHRGAPLGTLVSAFLFESSSTPSPTPAPTPQPGLLPGNGGPRVPDQPKLLSGDELKQLRQTDEKAYKEYIRTHDITQLG
jgi:hypothetical protein